MNVDEKLKVLKNGQIDIETKTDLVRSLRNECATNAKVIDYEELVSFVLELITDFEFCEVNDSELVFIRCSLQFVHNACVGRCDLSSDLMKLIFKCVKKCLCGDDLKFKNYASSLFLLILKQKFAFKNENEEIKRSVIQNLIQGVREEAEFCLFCIKHILQNEVDSVIQVFELIKFEDRLALIDIIMSLEENVSEDLVRVLSSRFKVQSDQILTTFKSPKDPLKPEEVRSLLTCLCQFSSSNQLKQREVLQEDKSLLINAVYLLKMINDLGKEDSELFKNLFSPIRKISDLEKNDFSDSPVFGFKSDLIRLIGNLCWKHKENQAMVNYESKIIFMNT